MKFDCSKTFFTHFEKPYLNQSSYIFGTMIMLVDWMTDTYICTFCIYVCMYVFISSTARFPFSHSVRTNTVYFYYSLFPFDEIKYFFVHKLHTKTYRILLLYIYYILYILHLRHFVIESYRIKTDARPINNSSSVRKFFLASEFSSVEICEKSPPSRLSSGLLFRLWDTLKNVYSSNNKSSPTMSRNLIHLSTSKAYLKIASVRFRRRRVHE